MGLLEFINFVLGFLNQKLFSGLPNVFNWKKFLLKENFSLSPKKHCFVNFLLRSQIGLQFYFYQPSLDYPWTFFIKNWSYEPYHTACFITTLSIIYNSDQFRYGSKILYWVNTSSDLLFTIIKYATYKKVQHFQFDNAVLPITANILEPELAWFPLNICKYATFCQMFYTFSNLGTKCMINMNWEYFFKIAKKFFPSINYK